VRAPIIPQWPSTRGAVSIASPPARRRPARAMAPSAAMPPSSTPCAPRMLAPGRYCQGLGEELESPTRPRPSFSVPPPLFSLPSRPPRRRTSDLRELPSAAERDRRVDESLSLTRAPGPDRPRKSARPRQGLGRLARIPGLLIVPFDAVDGPPPKAAALAAGTQAHHGRRAMPAGVIRSSALSSRSTAPCKCSGDALRPSSGRPPFSAIARPGHEEVEFLAGRQLTPPIAEAIL